MPKSAQVAITPTKENKQRFKAERENDASHGAATPPHLHPLTVKFNAGTLRRPPPRGGAAHNPR